MVSALAYSSNLHPAETVDELIHTFDSFSRRVREGLAWDVLGLDLRLGSRLIEECRSDMTAMARLGQALHRNQLQVDTINAFPLSFFQDQVVKDQAYHPDWTTEQRLEDSIACIDIALALSDSELVSISTLPGSFKPWGSDHNNLQSIATALGRWCAAAHRRRHSTNRQVVLCIEPEPWCTFEFSKELCDFFATDMAEAGLAACTADLDGDSQAAHQAIADHLGCCFDTCHVSVAFEDQQAAADSLATAGVTPWKVQFSACPEIPDPQNNQAGIANLRAMHEERFMHQTAALDANGALHQVPDLDRLDELLEAAPTAQCIRSHFHIPVDKQPGQAGIQSTVADSLKGLAACKTHGACHIAVETYTWSILAEQEQDAVAGTIDELAWLADQL